MMKTLGTIAVLGLVIFVPEVHAARKISVMENQAFGSFGSDLSGLRGRVGGDASLGQAIDHGIVNLRYLNGLRRQHDVPEDYLASVKSLDELIRSKANGDITSDEKAELVREVTADLETKAQCARKRLKPGDDPPPFDPVAVDARTKAGAEEVSGCQVWFVLRGWARYGKQESFPQFSSPSKKSLPPGNYYLWSSKDGKTGERSRIDLGADGSIQQSLDLAAPTP